jgi:hypothetical protein
MIYNEPSMMEPTRLVGDGVEATLAKRAPHIAFVFLAMVGALWWVTAHASKQPWDDSMKRRDRGEEPETQQPQSSGCGSCDCSGADCSGCDADCASCAAEGLCEAIGGLASCTVAKSSGAAQGASCPKSSPLGLLRGWAVLLTPLALLVVWRRRAKRDERRLA